MRSQLQDPFTYPRKYLMMQIVNRNMFIVKPKQPYVDLINAQTDQETPVSLSYFRRDCHTFLIPEVLGDDEAYEYIQAFKLEMFAFELNSWSRDPMFWPKRRTPAMFDEWFDLEFHSMIIDMEKTPLYKENL